MQGTKHIEISEELRSRILTGRYRKRLPSVRALAAEFDTSVRTISKSFKTLTQARLITPTNNGTLINSPAVKRPKNGLINIVSARLLCEPPTQDVMVEELKQLINAEGYTPILNEIIDEELFNNTDYWVNAQVDGHIFIYSSYYNFLLRQLNLQGVPYVVANWLPINHGVHWVDFNLEQCWQSLVQQIVEYTGNNRIAVTFPTALESINPGKRWLRERWLAIAEYFGIPDYFSDSSCFTYDLAAAAEEFATMPDPPQTVICHHKEPQPLRQIFKKHGLPLQLLLRSDSRAEPGDWQFENASYARLAWETWQVFKQVLDGTCPSPRSHLVEYQPVIDFNDAKSTLQHMSKM